MVINGTSYIICIFIAFVIFIAYIAVMNGLHKNKNFKQLSVAVTSVFVVILIFVFGVNYTIQYKAYGKLDLSSVKFSNNENNTKSNNNNKPTTSPNNEYNKFSNNESEINSNKTNHSKDTLADKIIGKWQAENGIIYEYKSNGMCVIDFSQALPNDMSADAIKVRNSEPISYEYFIEGDYLIYTMGQSQAHYRDYTEIKDNVLYERDSIGGELFVRKYIGASVMSEYDKKLLQEKLEKVEKELQSPFFKDLGGFGNPNGTISLYAYVQDFRESYGEYSIYIKATNGKEGSLGARKHPTVYGYKYGKNYYNLVFDADGHLIQMLPQ